MKDLSLAFDDIKRKPTDLFDHLPSIQNLSYSSYLSLLFKFEYSKFSKHMSINNLQIMMRNFAAYLDLFLNMYCNKTEDLLLRHGCIENITKLFSEYKFQNLKELIIAPSSMTARIEKNFIDAFPPTIQSLSFYQNENGLIIDQDAFSSNLKQLRYLYLCINNIESLSRMHFSNVINLEYLDLEKNRLKRLDENIFSDLKNLKGLSLRKNELEVLDANSFVGLENLIELNLSHNKLNHFEVRILSNLPRIERIDLSQNTIDISEREMLVNRFKESKIKSIF